MLALTVTQGSTISQLLSFVQGTEPITCELVGAPAGVSIDAQHRIQITAAAPVGTHNFSVRCTNCAGASSNTLAVNLVVQAVASPPPNYLPPVLVSGTGGVANFQVTENTNVIATIQATNPNLTGSLSYSLTNARPDSALFVVDPNTGALTWASPPDFENPKDYAGVHNGTTYVRDNEYFTVVRVTHQPSGKFVDLDIAIQVKDANDTLPGEPPAAKPTPAVTTNVRYVRNGGSNASNGLTEATAWATLQYAASQLTAGMTCYVKAGTYNGGFVPANSGTQSAPIHYVGYRNTPGDAIQVKSRAYPAPADATLLPLIEGGNRAAGVGIEFSGKSDIVFRNLQVRNFQLGMYGGSATRIFIDNCLGLQFGDVNASYDGGGIKVMPGSTGCVVRNCVVGNSAAESIFIWGTDNEVCDSISWANDNSTGGSSSQDYYIFLGGSGNRARRNIAHRIGALTHGGHGFTCKTTSSDHFIADNVAINFDGEAYALKHAGVTRNTLKRNLARNGAGMGLSITEGANNNLIEDHTIQDQGIGIMFYNTGESGSGAAGAVNNRIVRARLRNIGTHAIRFSNYTNPNIQSSGNVFDDLEVDGAQYLYLVAHKNVSMQMNRPVLKNIPNKVAFASGRTAADIGTTYTSQALTNCGFTLP